MEMKRKELYVQSQKLEEINCCTRTAKSLSCLLKNKTTKNLEELLCTCREKDYIWKMKNNNNVYKKLMRILHHFAREE